MDSNTVPFIIILWQFLLNIILVMSNRLKVKVNRQITIPVLIQTKVQERPGKKITGRQASKKKIHSPQASKGR